MEYNFYRGHDGTEYSKYLTIPNTWVHHVSFCVGYDCNYDCPYCINKYIRKEVRDPERVNMDNLKPFFNLPFDIRIDGFGEPLVYKDKLKYIADHVGKVRINIFTNGSLTKVMDELTEYSDKFYFIRSCSEKDQEIKKNKNQHNTNFRNIHAKNIEDLIIGDTPEVIPKYADNDKIHTTFLSKVDMSGSETTNEVIKLLESQGMHDNYWINNCELYTQGLSDCMDTICISCLCKSWQVFKLDLPVLQRLSLYQDETYFNKSKCFAQHRINDTAKEFDDYFNRKEYVDFREEVKSFYAEVFYSDLDYTNEYCDLIVDCSSKYNIALKPFNNNLIYHKFEHIYDKYLRSFGINDFYNYTYSRNIVKNKYTLSYCNFTEYDYNKFEPDQYIVVSIPIHNLFDAIIVGKNSEFYKVFSNPTKYRLYSKLHDRLFKYVIKQIKR